ncbi:XRE family transcriptional regulator [Rhizobium ruizarguesonis]|uniref:XRE family transcriptional regulator n=1 Tax=Rhizobium ruizarguesonis TaxID=2081791 RepID=UPI0009497797|nr:XRE family transcriptional regulator [Rhizobium ruizarguesonis]UED34222.1 XRE family transcriptional regulator [Rhizobium ruizarguesonis]
MSNIIGSRFKALRERSSIKTSEVAQALGLEDDDSISAIENGDRQPSADNIVQAMRLFKVSLEMLTDPFLLVNEGQFSWRQSGVSGADLAEYERDAGRFIAAYRALSPTLGHTSPINSSLAKSAADRASRLVERSSFENAVSAAENLAETLRLGAIPAEGLPNAIERELGILVLMVDPTDGISGAACKLSDADVILINRRDVPGRRNFDLGHELFHILTWRAMPPAHIEDINELQRSRVEQLADNFASALLMPSSVIARYGDWNALGTQDLIAKLNSVADELRVTSSALRWRLVGLEKLSRASAKAVPDERLRHNGKDKPDSGDIPRLYAQSFVELFGKAIAEGKISIRRAAALLQLTIDDLSQLFISYNIDPPFEI